MRLFLQTIAFLLISFLGFTGTAQAAATKIALVIGMGDYQSVPKLDNTLNDARGVADTLKSTGFEVTLALDMPLAQLLDTIDEFKFRAETAELAMVYFAGHGVEVQGENFLIPVDAVVRSNMDVQRQSISLDQLQAAVDGARVMRVIILDSCRDNPFGDSIDLALAANDGTSTDAATRSAGPKGLAPVDPDRGTIVVFAASAGQVALDGTGNNSPFATALMQKMAEPGVEISLMFRQVRDMVLQETANLQEPHFYGSLSGTPYFIAGPGEGKVDAAMLDDPDALLDAISADGQDQFAALADEGDTRAMVILAQVHANPNSDSYDPDKAVELFTKAADAGNAEAMFELAKMYEQGIFVQPDPDKALGYYQAAADLEFAKAVNELGFLNYQGGLGLLSDPAKGVALFEQAAALREPHALFNMAALTDDGLVPGKTYEDAAQYLYRALRVGNEDVLNQMVQAPEAFEPETRKALQRQLKAVGLYDGPIDGDFGPGTQASLRRAYGTDDA